MRAGPTIAMTTGYDAQAQERLRQVPANDGGTATVTLPESSLTQPSPSSGRLRQIVQHRHLPALDLGPVRIDYLLGLLWPDGATLAGEQPLQVLIGGGKGDRQERDWRAR
jgi:hypothetical protein